MGLATAAQLLAGCRGRVVVELGAGVCGLPSLLLARLGAHAVATDLPALVGPLQRNLDSNLTVVQDSCAAASVAAGSCVAVPLPWGSDPGLLQAVADHVYASNGRRSCDLIVAADVVYHEHLIGPLVDSLVQLTNPWPAPTTMTTTPPPPTAEVPPPATHSPPTILLTYVQRFKRSKRFFKQLRKHFVVQPVRLESVCDYDVLNWGWAGDGTLSVHSKFANKSNVEQIVAGVKGHPRRELAGDAVAFCAAAYYIISRKGT